jgi:hypothetical protein
MASSKAVKLGEERTSSYYLHLPTLSEGLGGDVARELLNRPPISQLPCAVDSAADDSDDLPPIPDTPTGYARFGFISRESFNTAVRDLVQESPDTPIGGDEAAPMKRPFNAGTLAMNGSGICLDAPQIEISSPPHMLEDEDEKTRALLSRSNFSDPFQESCESNVRPQTSASSPTMITAPQSPRADRINNQTSISLDGPGGGGIDVRDFAQQPGCPPLPDCCVSPRSLVSDGYVFAGPITDTGSGKENLLGRPVLVMDPVPIEIEELGTDKRSAIETASLSAVPVQNKAMDTGTLSAAGVSDVVKVLGSRGPNAPALSQVPVNIEEVSIRGPNPPNLQVPAVGIPTDVTGQLTPPGTPPKTASKGRRVIGKSQKVIRKGRRVILNRAALAVVLGRQLSRPTSQALKLISKGLPLDPSDLLGSATPAPAPRIPA